MKAGRNLYTSPYDSIQKKLSRPGNPVRKYQQAVVGVDSWFLFVLYELIECCITPVPSIIGRFLRSFFYPYIFNFFSRTGKIGRDITIHQPCKISIFDGVVIKDNVTLKVKGEGKGIILQENVFVGEKSIISCSGGIINIGIQTRVDKECRLGTFKGLRIGNNCQVGNQTYITGAGHAYSRLDLPMIQQDKVCRGETIIGDHVIIGARVTILDGVKIGDYAQIADDSLVLHDVAPCSFAKGVPAVSVAR